MPQGSLNLVGELLNINLEKCREIPSPPIRALFREIFVRGSK